MTQLKLRIKSIIRDNTMKICSLMDDNFLSAANREWPVFQWLKLKVGPVLFPVLLEIRYSRRGLVSLNTIAAFFPFTFFSHFFFLSIGFSFTFFYFHLSLLLMHSCAQTYSGTHSNTHIQTKKNCSLNCHHYS